MLKSEIDMLVSAAETALTEAGIDFEKQEWIGNFEREEPAEVKLSARDRHAWGEDFIRCRDFGDGWYISKAFEPAMIEQYRQAVTARDAFQQSMQHSPEGYYQDITGRLRKL